MNTEWDFYLSINKDKIRKFQERCVELEIMLSEISYKLYTKDKLQYLLTHRG